MNNNPESQYANEGIELTEEQARKLRKECCPLCEGFCPVVRFEDEREWQTPDGNFLEWTQIHQCQDCDSEFFSHQGT